jgi:hypothetical protein
MDGKGRLRVVDILALETLLLLLPLLAGCSGVVDTGNDIATMRPAPDGPARAPSSGAWELGHPMVGSATVDATATFSIEGTNGAPIAGVTFCSIPIGDCGESDAGGSVELPVPRGQTLIEGYTDTYVQPTIALEQDAEFGGDTVYRLHTPTDLDAIYGGFGMSRSEEAGTVIMEVASDALGEVSGVLIDARGARTVGVLVDDGSSDTSMSLYFLDVVAGTARVELSHDGEPCDQIEGAVWPSSEPSSLSVLSLANSVTYVGRVGCV